MHVTVLKCYKIFVNELEEENQLVFFYIHILERSPVKNDGIAISHKDIYLVLLIFSFQFFFSILLLLSF